jgi:hypothetical protein
MIVEISAAGAIMDVFSWQEELSALHFSCGFDMKVAVAGAARYTSLALANERLWLGHRSRGGRHSPAFRYTILLRGIGTARRSRSRTGRHRARNASASIRRSSWDLGRQTPRMRWPLRRSSRSARLDPPE